MEEWWKEAWTQRWMKSREEALRQSGKQTGRPADKLDNSLCTVRRLEGVLNCMAPSRMTGVGEESQPINSWKRANLLQGQLNVYIYIIEPVRSFIRWYVYSLIRSSGTFSIICWIRPSHSVPPSSIRLSISPSLVDRWKNRGPRLLCLLRVVHVYKCAITSTNISVHRFSSIN